MSQTKSIGQILIKVLTTKSKKDKIELLKQHKDNQALVTIFRLQFDDRFQFGMPEGTPPGIKIEPFPPGLGSKTINNSFTKFYIFLKPPTKIQETKLQVANREKHFIDFLECLDSEERDIMIKVKDKKLKGITKDLVSEVFPNIFPTK